MFNLNAFNIFKKPDADGGQSPTPDAEAAAAAENGSSASAAAAATGGGGFFQSINPSKLLDTVSSKKSGLLDDLSNKFDQITKLVAKDDAGSQPPAPPARPKRRPKQAKVKKEKKADDDDSSASEYGDDGDKPIYEDKADDTLETDAKKGGSTESLDEYSKQVKVKMTEFVTHVLNANHDVTAAEKKQFFDYAKDSIGQQVFCEELLRSNQAHVTEAVFQRLVECFSYVLNESQEAEDYLSARLLMNICFTIYYLDSQKNKVFLYEAVRSQSIWQSLRFWNAAFYDALRYERAKRSPRPSKNDEANSLERDREEQEMITFNLLSTFTNSMRTFGIAKDACLDFIKKQSLEAALSAEQVKILRNNMINWTEKQ